MEYALFVMFCLALYCPCFTLIALFTPWKGFAVFSVTYRRRQYWAVHLALLDRVGAMNRRQARRYHQAFVQALETARGAAGASRFFPFTSYAASSGSAYLSGSFTQDGISLSDRSHYASALGTCCYFCANAATGVAAYSIAF